MLVITRLDLLRNLLQDLNEFLAEVLEDQVGLLVGLVFEQALVERALDNELVLVGARHDVNGLVSRRLLRGALVQAEYLRQVVDGEVVLHMVLHLLEGVEDARREVRSHLLVIHLSRVEVLLMLRRVNLLHGQVVQLLLVGLLQVPASDAADDQTRLLDNLLVDEVPHCLRQDVLVLLINQLSAVVELAD